MEDYKYLFKVKIPLMKEKLLTFYRRLCWWAMLGWARHVWSEDSHRECFLLDREQLSGWTS